MSEKLKQSLKQGTETIRSAGLERLSEQERELFTTLVPKYRSKAIRPEEFSKYDKRQIIKDIEYVRKMEARFAEEEKQHPEAAAYSRRGELLEAIVWNGIEENGWFGPDAQAIVASRYDDIRNGVDQIIEVNHDTGFNYLALNVDVTSSVRAMRDKLSSIRKKIQDGQLSTVEYFQSEQSGIQGQKRHVPKVVIGAPPEYIRELSALEIQFMRLQKVITEGNQTETHIATKRDIATKLGNHPMQVMILRQIRDQLKTYSEFANSIKKGKEAREYSSLLTITEELLSEKEKELNLSRNDSAAVDESEIYITLREGLRNFGQ